jgi:hypothetical protein
VQRSYLLERSSGSRPVLNLEVRDAPELAGVVGDERDAHAHCVGCDQGVQRPDRRAGLLQDGPDPPVGRRSLPCEGENLERQQDPTEGFEVLLGPRTLLGTVAKLGYRDRGTEEMPTSPIP